MVSLNTSWSSVLFTATEYSKHDETIRTFDHKPQLNRACAHVCVAGALRYLKISTTPLNKTTSIPICYKAVKLAYGTILAGLTKQKHNLYQLCIVAMAHRQKKKKLIGVYLLVRA